MPNKPPTNATIRQPMRSHKADVTGANRNIMPRPIEMTHAKGKKKNIQKQINITNKHNLKTSKKKNDVK